MKWYWLILIIIVIIIGFTAYNIKYNKNTTPPQVLVDGLNGNFYDMIYHFINSNNKINN